MLYFHHIPRAIIPPGSPTPAYDRQLSLSLLCLSRLSLLSSLGVALGSSYYPDNALIDKKRPSHGGPSKRWVSPAVSYVRLSLLPHLGRLNLVARGPCEREERHAEELIGDKGLGEIGASDTCERGQAVARAQDLVKELGEVRAENGGGPPGDVGHRQARDPSLGNWQTALPTVDSMPDRSIPSTPENSGVIAWIYLTNDTHTSAFWKILHPHHQAFVQAHRRIRARGKLDSSQAQGSAEFPPTAGSAGSSQAEGSSQEEGSSQAEGSCQADHTCLERAVKLLHITPAILETIDGKIPRQLRYELFAADEIGRILEWLLSFAKGRRKRGMPTQLQSELGRITWYIRGVSTPEGRDHESRFSSPLPYSPAEERRDARDS